MDDPSTILQFELEQASIYLGYSTNVLYLFESCITVSQEVEVIWKRKWSSMTWIYAFTRYSSLILVLLNLIPIWGFTWLTPPSCKATAYVEDILNMMQFICFACFSALRVYALLDGKRILAGVVFLLNLPPFATNLYNCIMSTVVMDSEVCTTISSISDDLALRLSLATRIAVIIGDVLVLLITWSRTAQLYRESRRLGIRAPLATFLFRDGSFYFIVLLTINVLQAVERNVTSLSILDLSGDLLEILTPIIICRFTLDLRQVSFPRGASLSSKQSVSLRFVGNAGGSLRFGADEGEEDEENTVDFPRAE